MKWEEMQFAGAEEEEEEDHKPERPNFSWRCLEEKKKIPTKVLLFKSRMFLCKKNHYQNEVFILSFRKS